MLMIGWTGDAVAASFTMVLRYTYQRAVIRRPKGHLPDILLLACNPSCRSEWMTSCHVHRKGSASHGFLRDMDSPRDQSLSIECVQQHWIFAYDQHKCMRSGWRAVIILSSRDIGLTQINDAICSISTALCYQVGIFKWIKLFSIETSTYLRL